MGNIHFALARVFHRECEACLEAAGALDRQECLVWAFCRLAVLCCQGDLECIGGTKVNSGGQRLIWCQSASQLLAFEQWTTWCKFTSPSIRCQLPLLSRSRTLLRPRNPIAMRQWPVWQQAQRASLF